MAKPKSDCWVCEGSGTFTNKQGLTYECQCVKQNRVKELHEAQVTALQRELKDIKSSLSYKAKQFHQELFKLLQCGSYGRVVEEIKRLKRMVNNGN